MQYSEGRLGRVFVLRLDDGEDLLDTLSGFSMDHGIESAVVHILGGLGRGSMVTGPEQPVIPPRPHYESVEGAWELVGVATIFPSDGGSRVHLHASAGRGEDTLTGCLRGAAKVYLVLEMVIIEMIGLSARRALDQRSGLHLLSLGNPSYPRI
ncbi:MAG: hypothetical protein A4E45_01252 [Methanosaeta sp. PtaB.Bin039]|nr:MAG: hypothetical protein A4E45_01252 [Methanosaeta sp. PtaB.Bin039]OPY46230.1 MAG: hypothetical protein A4E47_00664 [Methanosaeta sp. PtaU1.Bin028]